MEQIAHERRRSRTLTRSTALADRSIPTRFLPMLLSRDTGSSTPTERVKNCRPRYWTPWLIRSNSDSGF